MKKKIAAVCAVLAVVSLTAGGTLAFFTDEKVAHNVITVGRVDVEIIETTVDAAGIEIPWPGDTGIHGTAPGDVIPKKVVVKNRDGSQSCWLRIGVVISASGPGAPGGFTPEPGLVHIDYNTADWTDGGDGFWYYRAALAPSELSEPLFTAVGFDVSAGNLFADAAVRVDVTAQAVQTAHNPETGPFDALHAAGWPE